MKKEDLIALGLTDEQILKAREEIKARVSQEVNEEIEIIDSFISDYPGEVNKQVPVWYLGKSIQLLSQADIAYFGGDWADARGCKLEHSIAEAYGLEVIEELKEEPNKTPNIYALTTSLLCNKRVDQVVSNLCTYELDRKSVG